MHCGVTKRTFILGVWLCIGLSAGAETLDLDDLFNEIEGTIVTNLNLSKTDQAELKALRREVQTELAGEYTAKLFTEEELHFVIPSPRLELELPAPPPLPAWPVKLAPTRLPEMAQPLVPLLKQVFRRERVPAQLVWVAEVESGFEPGARSSAGAVGLFQLMPATAEIWGLSLAPLDERLAPVKNARAAAQYFRYLYDKFGDWRLVLAAYNAGEGRVRRLLDQSRVRSFEQIASRLPTETQLYVPKVEATILRREGIRLADLKAE